MKELLLYGLAALGGLVILGYSVHMLIGGLVIALYLPIFKMGSVVG